MLWVQLTLIDCERHTFELKWWLVEASEREQMRIKGRSR